MDSGRNGTNSGRWRGARRGCGSLSGFGGFRRFLEEFGRDQVVQVFRDMEVDLEETTQGLTHGVLLIRLRSQNFRRGRHEGPIQPENIKGQLFQQWFIQTDVGGF
ncbi:MAG: hypothetical protein RIS24_2610 [Verrucomicrobiota bacterium]